MIAWVAPSGHNQSSVKQGDAYGQQYQQIDFLQLAVLKVVQRADNRDQGQQSQRQRDPEKKHAGRLQGDSGDQSQGAFCGRGTSGQGRSCLAERVACPLRV